MFVMLGDTTKEERQDLFLVKRKETMPYEFSDNVWLSITFEMSLDVVEYEREVYTFLMMLSDIGGLAGALVTLLSLFMALWNFKAFDNYLVSKLYRVRRQDEAIGEHTSFYDKSEYIKLSSFPNCGELLRCLFPKRWCCKRSRKDEALLTAREKMA